MPYEKIKYNNEYNKNHYKQISFRVKKGDELKIKTHWQNKGYKSLSDYLNTLIKTDMERNP